MLEGSVSKVNANFFIECDQILENRPRDHISHLYLSLFNITLKCIIIFLNHLQVPFKLWKYFRMVSMLKGQCVGIVYPREAV